MSFLREKHLPQLACGTSWKDTSSLRGQNNMLSNAMALMNEKRVRHLPVLEGNKLVGIVSIGDLVKSIIGDQKFTIDQLEHYIHG